MISGRLSALWYLPPTRCICLWWLAPPDGGSHQSHKILDPVIAEWLASVRAITVIALLVKEADKLNFGGTNCSWQPHTCLVDPIARAASGSALHPLPQVTNDQPCQTSTTWVPCMTVRRCSSLAGLIWLTSLWQHQMRYCSDENSFVQKGIQDEALCAGNLGLMQLSF